MSRQVNLGQIIPNIQIGETTTVSPETPASVTNTGTPLNPILNFTIPHGAPGAIKFEIVDTLPTENIQTDTIYLVPYATQKVQELPTTGTQYTIYVVESTGKRYVYESNQWVEIIENNRYIEYLYVNGSWEIMGGIGVQIDLTNYVQFTDYATSSKGGVIKKDEVNYGFNVSNAGYLFPETLTFTNYNTKGNPYVISKGTLENVITGKGLVSNTNYATSSVGGVIITDSVLGTSMSNTGKLQSSPRTYAQYTSASNYMFVSKGTLENVITGKDLTTKAYVDGLVGDLENILETLDIGSGV